MIIFCIYPDEGDHKDHPYMSTGESCIRPFDPETWKTKWEKVRCRHRQKKIKPYSS